MAMRSYLYAADEAPAPGVTGRVRGLGENNGCVPLGYCLLLSAKPRLTWSPITGLQTAIIADDVEASVERFFAVIDIVATMKIPNQEKFDRAVASTKKALTKPTTKRGAFFLLEASEIASVQGDEPEPGAKSCLKELKSNNRLVDDVLKGMRPYWFEQMANNWQQELGIAFWSDTLFFTVK